MKTYNIVLDKPSVTWVITKGIDSRIDSEYYSSIYLKKQLIEQENPLDYCELGSLGKGFSYGTPPYGNMAEQGVPYLRIPNIEDQFFLNDDLAFINEDYHLKNIRNEVDKGDILFRIKGQLGQAVVVPKRYAGAHTGSSFLKFTPTFIDPYFLVLYLSSSYGKNQILRKQSNSIIKYLNIDDIKSIKVPVPSPEIQKYIGDKVRRAEELREEAKRLKKETEDLIINKLGTINLEENRNYSSAFISSGKIVERIDSEYYHSKYLKIEDELNRKGYKVKKLGEVCTRIFNGRTYSTTDKERKYCNVGVGELGDWFVNKSKEKFINEKVDKKYCLKANSIIWGNAAHLAKYIGEKVNIVLEEETVIPTTEVTAIEPNEEAIDPYYLFIFMRTQWGYYQIQRTVKGMTAHSYPQDISNILVPIIDLTNEELEVLKNNVVTSYKNELNAKQLIQQAKQDVEDLIEGNFEMSKLNNDSSTESRC